MSSIFNEVQAVIDSIDGAASELMYGDAYSMDNSKFIFESIESYGGEDCGSEYYHVWKVTDGSGAECFIRFDGHYQSHYGTDFESYREVKPARVTKIEYV